ncbi:MAG TPA: trehalose-phosphatase [Terriglobales bacterium]|nr:trehalose-phosphatase [Terriglobales bacterium]
MAALAYADRLTAFFEQLHSGSTRILLLDYDGTLAPFRIERDLAFPYPEIPRLLSQIIASGTRVVLISGRPAQQLARLSGIHPQPEIWGSHGLERLRPEGSYQVEPLSLERQAGLREASEFLRSQGLESHMELKPGGVALHWRGLASQDVEKLKSKVQKVWRELAGRSSLELLDFDGGLEIRVRGKDKGNAVAAILRESNADAVIAYLGDDRTDEDAFRVLRGRGLTALVRDEFRPTLADIQLRPPQDVIRFLEDWLLASGQKD